MAPTPATTALIKPAAVAASIVSRRRSCARLAVVRPGWRGVMHPTDCRTKQSTYNVPRAPTDVEFTVFGCLAGMARDAVVGGEHLLLGQDEAQGRLELALGACS